MTRAACQPGERWLQRWGKKLGGQYAIITAFVNHATRRLRFDVHLTSKCLRFSLVCTHQAMLEPACGDDDRLLVEMVKGIAMDLEVRETDRGTHSPVEANAARLLTWAWGVGGASRAEPSTTCQGPERVAYTLTHT